MANNKLSVFIKKHKHLESAINSLAKFIKHGRRFFDLSFIIFLISSIAIDLCLGIHIKNLQQISIVVTCMTTIVSIVITISMGLYDKEIANLSWCEISQLLDSHYSLLEMVIISILLVGIFAGVVVPNMPISMIITDIWSIAYTIIFSVQSIPLLTQQDETIRKIIRNAKIKSRENDKNEK